MYCANDKTTPGVSSSQSSKNVKDGKFWLSQCLIIFCSCNFWLCCFHLVHDHVIWSLLNCVKSFEVAFYCNILKTKVWNYFSSAVKMFDTTVNLSWTYVVPVITSFRNPLSNVLWALMVIMTVPSTFFMPHVLWGQFSLEWN